MQLKKELGIRIKKIRKSLNMTQDYLAECVGVDPKNISRIESGKTYPSADTLTEIAKALGVEIYELFVFREAIDYAHMKNEIVKSLENPKNILFLYKEIKGL